MVCWEQMNHIVWAMYKSIYVVLACCDSQISGSANSDNLTIFLTAFTASLGKNIYKCTFKFGIGIKLEFHVFLSAAAVKWHSVSLWQYEEVVQTCMTLANQSQVEYKTTKYQSTRLVLGHTIIISPGGQQFFKKKLQSRLCILDSSLCNCSTTHQLGS